MSLLELTTEATIKALDPASVKDDTLAILDLIAKDMRRDDDNVCFMDMRGKEQLRSEDSRRFNFVLFGGILGDHPPKDRA